MNKKFILSLLITPLFLVIPKLQIPCTSAFTQNTLPNTPLSTATINFLTSIENPSLLNPDILDLEIKPGSSVTKNIIIKNINPTNETIDLYATDQLSGTSSLPTYKTRTETQEHIGKWIYPEQTTYTFTAGETKKIPIAISIPADTKEGDYSGGIVIEKIFTEAGNPLSTAYRVVSPLIKIKVTTQTTDPTKTYQPGIVLKPYFYITTSIFVGSMIYLILTWIRKK